MKNVFLYFMTLWNILRPFAIIYGRLVEFAVIWNIFSILVSLDQVKSGNPARNANFCRPTRIWLSDRIRFGRHKIEVFQFLSYDTKFGRRGNR
jgi:hypothetical protein